jgi:hypothetical protein
MSNHKSQDRGDRGVSEVVGEDILPHVIKFVESEYFESRSHPAQQQNQSSSTTAAATAAAAPQQQPQQQQQQ